jgi:hypothetical protein
LLRVNWRRGLFRLWIIGAALFVLGTAFISYGEIKMQFEALAGWNAKPAGFENFVPQLCGDARGIAGTDYSVQERRPPGPWDEYKKPNPFDNCWYIMSAFRRLYPEYNNRSDNELIRTLYPDHGIPDPIPNPWRAIGMWAGIAFGIPLSVLILGACLGWALAGFAARPMK